MNNMQCIKNKKKQFIFFLIIIKTFVIIKKGKNYN